MFKKRQPKARKSGKKLGKKNEKRTGEFSAFLD
jgi:hypothetical protein